MRAGNFLQNLWFNDEEGGESPPVHIRFFSLHQSGTQENALHIC